MDTVVLHSNYYKSYSPTAFNQPKGLFIDSNKFVRCSTDGSLFNGLIMEEYSQYNHPQSTIDTLIFYFNFGSNTSQKKLIYKGSEKKHFITKQPERYFLNKVIYGDTTIEYDQDGFLLQTTIYNTLVRVKNPTLPIKELNYIYSPSNVSFVKILEKEYESDVCHQLVKEISIYDGDTTTISIRKHFSCYGAVTSTETSFDRSGKVSTVYSVRKSSQNDKGHEIITHFNENGDTIFHSEFLNGLTIGYSVYTFIIFSRDTNKMVSIKSYWNQGFLERIECENAIFLDKNDNFINPKKFVSEYKKYCVKSKLKNSPTTIQELIKYLDFQNGELPEKGPYFILKCGDLDNPMKIYRKYLNTMNI